MQKSIKDYCINEGIIIIIMNVKTKPINVIQVNPSISNDEKKESTEKQSQTIQPKVENKTVDKPTV